MSDEAAIGVGIRAQRAMGIQVNAVRAGISDLQTRMGRIEGSFETIKELLRELVARMPASASKPATKAKDAS